jgi:hypothetical protein
LSLVLGGLVLGTAFASLEILIAPSLTPLPSWTYPEAIALSGYRVTALGDRNGFRTRVASHGPMRRFQLQPKGAGPSLMVMLKAVRSADRQFLSKEAFGSADPNLQLQQRRVITLPPGSEGGGQQGSELALGRGAADPAGSTTRLQTCLTPGGEAAVGDKLLVGTLKQQRNREFRRDPLGQLLRHWAGEPWSRWECLVVQLSTGASGDHQLELEKVWQNLRPQLINPKDH